MRTLARAAISSLAALGAALALVAVAVAVIGILATRSATGQGNVIAGDELTTAIVTGQLGRSMDAAYAAGQQAVLATAPAERSRLLGSLYTQLLPAVDARLFMLDQLHAADPPDEHADIELFGRQWAVVRNRLSPANLPSSAPAAGDAASADAAAAKAASALAAAYAPVSAHLGLLSARELDDARADHAGADAGAVRSIALIAGAAALGLALGALLLTCGIRRIRGHLEPGQDQAEFADTLQIAGDEDEAQRLLQRHLERALPATSAVVLNRNNSADRLEAVTPLPDGSPLPGTLRGAEPRSCLAVRSGRTHREDGGRPPLLSCPVCAPVPGTSCCVPLTVGGEVIGSVLLSRPAPTPRPRSSGSASPSARPRRSWPTCATWRSPRSAPPPTGSPGCPTSARSPTR